MDLGSDPLDSETQRRRVASCRQYSTTQMRAISVYMQRNARG